MRGSTGNLVGKEMHNGDPRLYNASRLSDIGINKTQLSRVEVIGTSSRRGLGGIAGGLRSGIFRKDLTTGMPNVALHAASQRIAFEENETKFTIFGSKICYTRGFVSYRDSV